ncbi:YlbL family protein [Arcanobacterium pinnipediorum]|uniref:Pdz/dhr/glgf protein n=1 Tax=Arcanobacterium pinnipediorum TaxID=1503041 RepID=A0ABY5AHS3_9ACTO|nr:S16 family serine protease [Arcanobacterium pinnipediorum]USR79760.1 pdz/dhr/glgf protein [Arcanobacterium pinnipediorum]
MSSPNLQPAKSPAIPALLFGILMLAALLMPTSFIVMRPGPANDVSALYQGTPIVDVTGLPTYPSETQLLMTTVSAYGSAETGANGATVTAAIFNDSSRIVPIRALYAPNQSADEISARDQQMMMSSQDTAAVVAMERAGLEVSMNLVVVGNTNEQADLVEGDVIRAVRAAQMDQPQTVATFGQLTGFLAGIEPGTTLSVSIERDGVEREVSVVTQERQPEFDGSLRPGSIMGVLINVTDVTMPAQAHYVIDGIGGPSAGNIFSVEIYDQLTPGSLGGDHIIAGTGALSWDGTILPIGGIAQKLVGAYEAGARDFLAPAANCFETTGRIPDGMNVWAVRTIDDSIQAVKAIGAADTSDLTPCSAVRPPVDIAQ